MDARTPFMLIASKRQASFRLWRAKTDLWIAVGRAQKMAG